MTAEAETADLGTNVPLTIVLCRTGKQWEGPLAADAQAAAMTVVECRTMVEVLLRCENDAVDVVVLPDDLPRLHEGLSRLRALARVVVVGGAGDCPADQADLNHVLRSAGHNAPEPGRIVTVWGPPGSWGTTTVACGLAEGLARDDATVLLDANVHAAGVGDRYGLALGGLLQACLAVDRGADDLPCTRLDTGLHVLTGVEPAMYPAVHPGAFAQVLAPATRRYRHVVVDVDSAVDPGADIGLVPDWTTATMIALASAAHVVIVVGDTPAAQQRLWRSLPGVVETVTGKVTVVINRCEDPRAATTRVAARLGQFLPEAAVGFLSSPLLPRALDPIVSEVAR
jgi:Flp pilus assembly CpaE family ATPase